MTRLSICIPTHNRAHTLPALFESIRKQHRPGVEVVISDNASTDKTEALVCKFTASLPAGAVRYIRVPENRGFDANIARVVDEAAGDYCWIVGSDDELYVGAIARVLDTMQNAPGCLIVGDVHNRAVVDNGAPRELVSSTRYPDYSFFWLDEPGAVAEYLAGAQTIHASFPFISNTVFPRSQWTPHLPPNWANLSYSHLYKLWRMVLDGVPVVTRRKPFVWASSGYPDRRDAETMGAAQQSVNTIEQLVKMFGDPRDKAAIRTTWRYEYPRWRIKSLEERCHHEPAWLFVRAGLHRALGYPLQTKPR